MIRVRTIWLALLAAAFGCATSGGGPVGTGISSSTVSGNVVAVQTTSVAASGSAAALPRIEVSIDEVPGLSTTADTDGNFELGGDFSGAITLRFTTPQFEVTQPLDVPAGSAVVLSDISLRPDAVDPGSTRQLDFRGVVDLIDCTSGEVLVHDQRDMGEPNQFMVRLENDTTLLSADGQARTCADIQAGNTIAVEGLVQVSDRTIIAVRITLAPPPSGGPQPTRPVHFSGQIVSVDCATGIVVLDDNHDGQSRLQLSASTTISGAGGRRLQCSDLAPNDPVGGDGVIRLQRPGVIEVQALTRGNGAGPMP